MRRSRRAFLGGESCLGAFFSAVEQGCPINSAKHLFPYRVQSNSIQHEQVKTKVFVIPVFLPAAGYRNNNDGSLNNQSNNGNYWSSTPNESNSSNAYNLNFNSSNADWNNNNRANGQSIRCVAELIKATPASHFHPSIIHHQSSIQWNLNF